MSSSRNRGRHGRQQAQALRALTIACALVLLATVLFAGTALAAGHGAAGKSVKTGAPTTMSPSGTIATTTPTFTWGKASGAVRYELRVYKGSKLQFKKAGITALSWKAGKALVENAGLTWKVRASSARGTGAWSKSLKFKIVVPRFTKAKAITAFSLQATASAPAAFGIINESDHTVSVTVPHGTSVTVLVPTIAITGASVSPASGVATNFSGLVTYTVTAGDGTTQPYVVTVTVASSVAIGESRFGGTVAYVLEPGDPGYSATVQHGLIAATGDQGAGIPWANGRYQGETVPAPGARGRALGTGLANTNAIVAQQGAGDRANYYAAGLAWAYVNPEAGTGVYSDWYLPSIDELGKLDRYQDAIGGFASDYYWSSSEAYAEYAWYQSFRNETFGNSKDWAISVRAVRAF